MNTLQSFDHFLVNQSTQIEIGNFIANMLLTALLSFLIGRIYVRYGSTLSNRRLFARNFILISVTTMVIITIVKASLALSLGLVGALSIVRFRSAIKEPEELAYLFLLIAIGLGLGAGQRAVTLIAFTIVSLLLVLLNRLHRTEENQNMYLSVSSSNPQDFDLNRVVDILKQNCTQASLKRFDETQDLLETTFVVEFASYDQLEKTKRCIKEINDSITITYLDNKGIT